ncbi:DUF732 domain-containing protein [Rhodococcus sp. DT1]|uniref:DUF732 domain-containing protein n=1 Tax=unclassified Rhodococcus (in: high G+C Gram-positive bacteria) TaxID=192944 RepID=UPI0036677640
MGRGRWPIGAAARVLLAGAAVLAAAACSAGTADPVEAVETPTATAAAEPPVLDARATRMKETLDEAGLVADVPDETLLAVARGLCDQLAAGMPEERILETARPIASYAAAATHTTVPGDDAARHYVEITRETYC